MKKYNIQNYIRYKEEIKALKPKGDVWNYFDRQEVIHKYLPLVENLARKFSTSDQASGILSILDLIQIGSEALVRATDKLDWSELEPSRDIDQTLKSFFSKRIKGAIRRRIDMYRGNMRIPEHRLNEMRKLAQEQPVTASNKSKLPALYEQTKEQLDNYISDTWGELKNVPSRNFSIADSNAYDAGRKAANSIGLNTQTTGTTNNGRALTNG